jgi:quercetin dioxygenase-like cupin family protein
MRLHTLAVGSAVTVLALSGLAASTASATPATGSVTTNPTTPLKARLAGPLKAKADGVSLKIKEDATVRHFDLTYGPGATSGWHEHPGIVLAVVKSGTVTRKTKCEPTETFTVGQAFTEVGAHFVRNPGTEPAVLGITQILPADAPAFRVDLERPKCHRHS